MGWKLSDMNWKQRFLSVLAAVVALFVGAWVHGTLVLSLP